VENVFAMASDDRAAGGGRVFKRLPGKAASLINSLFGSHAFYCECESAVSTAGRVT
jgi:hypothetical protein